MNGINQFAAESSRSMLAFRPLAMTDPNRNSQSSIVSGDWRQAFVRQFARVPVRRKKTLRESQFCVKYLRKSQSTSGEANQLKTVLP
jgi:hypothetical protein